MAQPKKTRPIEVSNVTNERPPGWYSVGTNPNDQDYWDGSSWTARRRWSGATWTEAAQDPSGDKPSFGVPTPEGSSSHIVTSDTDGAPIQVGFGEPERQNRWTVGFRFILAIPHLIALGLVGIAAAVVAVVGWFAALVLGRLPAGIASFLSGYVRYATRVYAYYWLLVDRFPPFDFGTSEYPVNVEIHPGKLNRLAVLFRLVLIIPAGLVVSLASGGMFIAAIFIWLIVLVAGRAPTGLFHAIAATQRYQARAAGYMLMVTSTYPWGIFGDRPTITNEAFIATMPPSYPPTGTVTLPPPISPMPSATPGEVATLPTPPGPPPTPYPPCDDPVVPPPFASAQPPSMPGVVGASLAYPPAPPPPPPSPLASKTNSLVLSTAGKTIVVVFLVLGVFYDTAVGVFDAGRLNTVSSLSALIQDHNALTVSASQFDSQTSECSRGDLQCIQQADANFGHAFQAFGSQISAISFPSASRADASALESLSAQLASLLQQLSTSSATTYESIARSIPDHREPI